MKRYIKEGGHGDRLHRFFAEQALGRELKAEEQVHHISLDIYENFRGNLVICPNQAYHQLLHTRTEAFLACGDPSYRKCYFCKEWCNPINMSQVRRSPISKRPTAGNYFYHKECARERYHENKAKINPRRNLLRRKCTVLLDVEELLSEI